MDVTQRAPYLANCTHLAIGIEERANERTNELTQPRGTHSRPDGDGISE